MIQHLIMSSYFTHACLNYCEQSRYSITFIYILESDSWKMLRPSRFSGCSTGNQTLSGDSVSTEDTVIQQFQIPLPSCVYISDNLDFPKRKRQWNSGQNSPKGSFTKDTHVLKFAKLWLPDWCCQRRSNAGTVSHVPDASQYTSMERLPFGCITPV